MIKLLLKNYIFTLALLTFINSANAVEVIRSTIVADTDTYIVDISLFDHDSPITVSNFLNNIDNNAYAETFINRSITNFVLQSGGYRYNGGSFSYDGGGVFSGGLQPATTTKLDNEFNISNTRGTLAMAKPSIAPGDDPSKSDSHEWFINLSDNTFLDESRSGFTVFGEILADGMQSIDLIAETPTFDLIDDIDLGPAFSNIPLTNYDDSLSASDITIDKLVTVKLERLFDFINIIDFGDATIGNIVPKDIVVSNTSDVTLSVNSSMINSITSPFSITSNDCPVPPAELSASTQCTISIEFSPAVTGEYYESTSSIEVEGYTFPVTLKTPGPDIELSRESIDFGFQPVYTPDQDRPEQAIVLIDNVGDRPLNFSSIDFTSATVEEFDFIDNCTVVGNAITPGELAPESFCILVINFKPADLTLKSAAITIISNDPNEQSLVINITGGSNTDGDGIDNLVEDAAPNGGDGNNDGNPDRLQNNVASFPSTNNSYTTLVAYKSILFTNVQNILLSTIEKLPDGVSLKNEAFSFEMSGITAGSIVEFGIILPIDGTTPANIYSYGPTLDNTAPHWYPLENDTVPGVFMIGNATLSDDTGNMINRNLTVVRIQDGGAGDSDQLVNGKISFVGGAELKNETSTSAGMLLWILLLIPVSIALFRK